MPQGQYMPQVQYQPQGQYQAQGLQPPLGQQFYLEQQFLQGGGNYPANYQPYVQLGYGPSYLQPSMGQYPRINMVWDPSQVKHNFQPNVEVSYYQPEQPIGYGPIQHPV